MSVADYITIGIIVAAVVFAFILDKRRKKNGCCSRNVCNGQCENCNGHR